MKITTLIENNKGSVDGLEYEHGLSFFIEINDKHILFDTGQTGAAIENAKKLHIDLAKTNYLILSHGHYDHTGGVKRLLENGTMNISSVLVGEGFFNSKYKIVEDELVFIGNSFDKGVFNEKKIPVLEVDAPKEFENGVWIFREFQNNNEFEEMNPKFVRKEQERLVLDDFKDEVSLAIQTTKGLVVIVGCSHPGILNILTTIHKSLNLPIYAVVGGSHLVDADEKRIMQTITAMKDMQIKKLYLSHCTGELAMQFLKKEFGEDFILNHTGDKITIL